MTRAAITQDEFDAWRDEPVTQWVMEACRRRAETIKNAWAEGSFSSGIADQATLTELKTRADAYRALPDTPYENWLSAMEEE